MTDAEHVQRVCEYLDGVIQAWLDYRSADTAAMRDVPIIVKKRKELESLINDTLPLIATQLDNLARRHLQTEAGEFGEKLHIDLRGLPKTNDEGCERRIMARYDRLLQLRDLIGQNETNVKPQNASTATANRVMDNSAANERLKPFGIGVGTFFAAMGPVIQALSVQQEAMKDFRGELSKIEANRQEAMKQLWDEMAREMESLPPGPLEEACKEAGLPPPITIEDWGQLARIVEKDPDPMTLGEIADWALVWFQREKARLHLARAVERNHANAEMPRAPTLELAKTGNGNAKGKGGKPPLEKSANQKDKLKLQIYERIRNEREAGLLPKKLLEKLKSDNSFKEQVKEAGLTLNKSLLNAVRAFFSQPNRKMKETETS